MRLAAIPSYCATALWGANWVVPLGACSMVYGIHVDGRTIDHRKSAVLAIEGEQQVGSSEENGFGTQFPTHPFPRREKRFPLVLGDPTCLGHFDVAPMYSLEGITFGSDDRC